MDYMYISGIGALIAVFLAGYSFVSIVNGKGSKSWALVVAFISLIGSFYCIFISKQQKEQKQYSVLQNKKSLVSKRSVQFYTKEDNTLRNIDSYSSDTSLIFSGNRVFPINEIVLVKK